MASAVADAYSLGGAATLAGPVARGEVGQVWRLEAAAGVFAVKEPFHPADDGWAEGFREAADFQDTARSAGVHSPGVVRTQSGDVVAWFDRSPVRVYEWVDMAPADGGIDPAAVGSMLARLHTCGFEGRVGTHWWYRAPVGADRWDDLVEGTARAGAPFAADLRAMRDELVALEQILEDPSVVQTCHRDVWADNVRATPAGPLVVIDWEGMGLADPSGELAMVLFEFAHADADRAHSLAEAYRAGGGPGRVDHLGVFTMVSAQFGHLIARICTRWIEAAPEDPERTRLLPRFAEFVDKPHSRELYRAIIDAVA